MTFQIRQLAEYYSVILVIICLCLQCTIQTTLESLSALKNDLLVQNWNIIYHDNDVNSAYDTFKDLRDKNCPV